ncbi:hydantoinase B/oxoprolinase family protein [Conexibacter sp. DBS9H8]|uniref:hydantoinase B/oxoprolinase family protein n=1 Tax=Conexibacter sp. DBS9H8 TaxID=2937801 RepID=UPI00200E3A31|nr:hydantoinase B/oxoprolinase family protein [Conexibacter sp. DBS9H8]
MIDPITLSVVRSGLEQICNEMDQHLIRSSMSPIISETNDCAHGIYDPRNGETIAQGAVGLPVFLANMQFAVQSVLAEANASGGFRPGEVWILNEVYRGGTHLNDVNLVAPVFVDGELFALIASTGHWMDIGGNAPGGWNPEATEIHQEGIVIPPVRLWEDGKRNDALVAMIIANVRLPRDMLGDLVAMSSAVQMGERRLRELVDRYSQATLGECLVELVERSERQMRAHIAEIPDGVYAYSDTIDNDGVVDEPLRIAVEVTVAGDSMSIDFSGTSAAARGPLNLAANSTISTCYVALKHIYPDVPINGGTFRPATVHVPAGTVTAAEYPRPVSGYLEVANRVFDVMLGALAQAIPELVPAAPFGTIGVVTVGGVHPETGRYYVGVFPYPGGYGATGSGDGLVNGTPPISMANFVALEASEHRYPLMFEYFALRENSGGAGHFRGGDGTTYKIVPRAPLVISVMGDRHDSVPFGLNGGGPALANELTLELHGEEWIPAMRTKLAKQEIGPGDSLTASSPGGGGHGDPLTRPLELVEQDLNFGYITAESAEEQFGVAIAQRWSVGGHDRFRLDPERSEQLRAARGATALTAGTH